MLTKIFRIFAGALFTLWLVPAAFTQSSANSLRVTVPFAFEIGSTTLPAGEYTITRISSQAYKLSDASGRNASFFLYHHAQSRLNRERSPHLIFNRYASTSYLSQIWHGNTQNGSILIKSGKEKRLSARQLHNDFQEVVLLIGQ